MGGSGGRLVKSDAQVVSCGTEMPTTDGQVGCSLGEFVFFFILKASVWRSPLLVGSGDRLLQELLSADNRAVSHDL